MSWRWAEKIWLISASNPVVKFDIKGLSFNDIPFVEYNNVRYELTAQTATTYISPNLPLDSDAKTIRLIIGDKHQDFGLKLDLGSEEDDLFDF